MCKSLRRTHGTAATDVPVAHLLASEAPEGPKKFKGSKDAQSFEYIGFKYSYRVIESM